MKIIALLFLASLCLLRDLRAAEPELKPLMLVPGEVLFKDDFNTPRGEVKARAKDESAAWLPNQGTRWEVTDGVLRGRASSPEYQAAHDTHKGVHPRIVLTKTPENYILQFSMRIVDGKPFVAGRRKAVPPFIEMGHHVARVTWGADGALLLADGDTLQVASAKDFQLPTGQWEKVLIERRDDEVLVQFANGPTFHGKHPSYKSDRHAVMLGGLEAGTLEVDNVTLWAVKDGTQPGWAARLATLPAPQQVRLKDPKPAAAKEPAK
jgi:hypothetical protein